jgi:peptidoglycan/LPS O-acetylase OafA/YrhL
MTEPAFKGHYPKLDGLRAVAISLVLLHHFGGYLAHWFDAGYYGVDLFFVISGFLITSILIRDSDASFGRAYRTFLGRRTLRIFPVYYFAIIALYILNFATTRQNIGFLATYTWNYARYRWQGSELFYLWSLSTEEQFYLFWPFIALLLRRHLRALLTVTVLIITIGYGQTVYNMVPQLAPFNYTGLINRMGSLGLGALGAIVFQLRLFPPWFYRSLPLEIAAGALLIWTQCASTSGRFPVMGLCSLYFVLKAVHGEFRIWGVARCLESNAMIFLGRISYGVYIYHVPIDVLFTHYIFDPFWHRIPFSSLGPLAILRWHSWIIKFPLYSLLSIGIATASYYLIERRILTLKENMFPTSASHVAVAEALPSNAQASIPRHPTRKLAGGN